MIYYVQRYFMFIDTHAHIFEESIKLDNVNLNDILAIIVPSYNKENLGRTLLYCKQSPKFLPALGIHPQYCHQFTHETQNFIKSHINEIVAVGEIGLDTRFDNFESQIPPFVEQMQLAYKHNLPVSVHLIGERAFDVFFEVYKSYPVKTALHCFSGSAQNAERALNLDIYLSFACNITYKANVVLRKIAEFTPLNRILLETDSPSMLPASFMRKGTNTPQNIHFVAQKITEIKKVDIEEVANITTQNAIELFNLKEKLC